MRIAIPSIALAASLVAPVTAFAQSAAPSHEARLRGVQSAVEIATGRDRHNGGANEALQAGQRISTRANAGADLSLDIANVHLGENSSLLVFAPIAPPAAGQTATDDTSLVRGQASVSIPARLSRPAATFSIATRAATFAFDAGDEATISSDAAGTTRLAVQRGSVRVRASGRDIAVRAGTGVRIDPRRPPTAARPLPASPVWAARPPAAVLSRGESVNVSGAFGAATRSGPAIARWHVQIARDEAFADRVLDQTVPGNAPHFEARQLAPGRYYARVAAVDADRFESPFGEVANITVGAPHVVPGGNGRRARVEIPTGFFCGLDGGPLVPSTGALWLLAARPHTVRCATSADGRDAMEIPIRTADTGPILHDVRIQPDDFDSLGGTRTVVVRLTDAAGLPIAYADVRATVNEGASLEPFREADERGVYTATLQWRRGLAGLRMHFTVNEALEFDEHRGVTHENVSREE